MSGICGLVRLDGAAASTGQIDPMLAALASRGPDRRGSRLDGVCALGHALLATTPESEMERLPLTHAPSGCMITADARLDNRAELAAASGGDPRAGDGALILASYLRWGEECVQHLLGDFAFAIWDPRARRLFAARDHMGMRQLSYAHLPGRLFLFATDYQAAAAQGEVPRELDLARVADFLDQANHFDLRSTFFKRIERLEPAHILTLDSRGLSLRRYWTLEAPPPLRLSSEKEYSAALAEELDRAIAPRLRSRGKVGAMLSGGLDSTSVCAAAARLLERSGRGPLQGFSVVSSAGDCAETQAIRAAQCGIPNLEPHLICFESSDGDSLTELTRRPIDPFDVHLGLLRAVYDSARSSGVNVILDGMTADISLGPHSHTVRLLQEGRLLAAARETWGEARFWGNDWPLHRVLIDNFGRAFVPRRLRALRRAWLWRRRDGDLGHIDRGLAEKAGLLERRSKLRLRDSHFDVHDDQEVLRWLRHPILVNGREGYDRVAGQCSVEARDPFIDIRLLRFCLSLPAHLRQRNGYPKYLLRRAMAGLVPDAVRWRRGKEHLGANFSIRMFTGAQVPARPLFGLVRREFVPDGSLTPEGIRATDGLQIELSGLANWLEREFPATE